MKAPIKIAEISDRLRYVIQTLGPRGFFDLLTSRLFTVDHYYLLGKNLAAPLECPPDVGRKTPLVEISKEDIANMHGCFTTLGGDDKKELLARLFFYRDGFRNCYVTKNGDEIAFMQWIIFPSENEIIKEKYSTKFSPLSASQVVIENAFTFPRYRGRGYLQYGTAKLLEFARSKGYKSAICYIRKDRVASLNEFTKMGFKIIRIMAEYKVLGQVWRKL